MAQNFSNTHDSDLVYNLTQAQREKSLFLFELAGKLAEAKSIPDISEILQFFIPKMTNVEFFVLYLCDSDQDTAKLEYISHKNKTARCEKLLDSTITSWIYKNRKPSIIPPEFLDNNPANHSVLGIPLLSSTSVLGLIYIFMDQSPNEINQQILETTQVLATLTSLTCENLRLLARTKGQNEELERTKTYLYNILDSMIHGVVVLDAEKNITILSKSAEILLGVSAHLALEENYRTVFNPDFSDLLEGVIEDTIRTDYVLDKEFSCRLRGGIKIPLGISASKLKDTTGNFIGIIVILRDLSGAKRLATLANLNRMKSEFVSTVAHEFKVPLNLVISSSNMLCSGLQANMSETQLKLLEFIKNGGIRLNSLISDLLELSRIETANVFEKTEHINIIELLTQVNAALEAVALAKDVTLTLEPQGGEPFMIFGNRERLYQAFHNITHNAIKYNLEGGKVEVSWRKLESQGQTGGVEVKIADNGIGMEPDALESIFEEFVRLKDPRSNEEGTGLGLTIVKRIVEMHKGSIQVQSNMNEGTTFTLEFPVDFRRKL